MRKAHGLRDDLPALLVLSGGFGMGPVAEILAELDKIPTSFQTLVVAGRNEELRRELAAQARQFPQQIHRIFIRDVTEESAKAVRYQAASKDVPREKWRIFRQLDEIRDRLK